MGSNTSKPSGDASVPVQKSDIVSANSDPRSPTPEIVRTPLQESTSTKHSNITKNADLRKTFECSDGEEKLIHKNPILSAVIKNHLQLFDPRSPTQDFERTPIIISQIDDDKKHLRLQNDNFGSPYLKDADIEEHYDSCVEAQEHSNIIAKNLCDGFYDITLNETIKETEEPLGSSTASNEAIENNISHRSQPTELLETNFDYVENEDHGNNEDSTANTNIISVPCTDLKNIPLFKILPEDPRSPSAGIERTPIVVAKAPDESYEENVEEMSDDKLIKVLQNTNADLRHSINNPITEGVLIYEDELNDMIDTPKKAKSSSSSGSRTPLSCMKNKAEAGHARSKSANTLDESKGQKQIKISRRVSHIPRLKSLQTKLTPTTNNVSLKNITKKTVIGGDCENTPPHSHRDKWDKDNSIVL